ncbi:MAG: hypothetical protein ACYC8T_16535 [Myxococcaceae bacterium]
MARRLAFALVLAFLASCQTKPIAVRVQVGGNVQGLVGSGLVLQLNEGDDLPIRKDGPFLFGTLLPKGTNYTVSVKAHPTLPAQQCLVTSGSGTTADANVFDVGVTCTTRSFSIGGTVSGLEGTGLVLRNSGTDNLAITANGPFIFERPVESGFAYSVVVATQPTQPTQSCSVESGFGIVGAADVNVVVNCSTHPLAIGGKVTGLVGSGLVLQNNGAGDLPILPGATSYSFAAPRDATYTISVKAQPTNPLQTCQVANAGGATTNLDVTNIDVTCTTNLLAVGGSVTGLTGTGLVLHNSDGTDLALAAGATSYHFDVPSNGSYAVTVKSQPTNPVQVCAVSNPTGTVAGAPVTNVQVTCTTALFTAGGAITGLTGTGLVLQNNGADDLLIPPGATSFSFTVASGSPYSVSVKTQPMGPNQVCAVSNPTGTITNANVVNVALTCAISTFTVGGTITGLAGSGLTLQNNGGSDLAVSPGATGYTFTVPSGSAYAVTVKSQPVAPSQTCTVVNATGTVSGAVANVHITCSTSVFTVGGTVTGLAGSGLVLQNNGGSDLTVPSGSTGYTFSIASNNPYAVTVKTHPSNPSQTCAVSNSSGTVTSANVTDVHITCTTTSFTVGGTLMGLSGSGLVLQNNGAGDLTVLSTASSYSFAVSSNSAYAVSVKTQPTSPTQVCTVANSSGTVTNVNVTNVTVTCVSTSFRVGGTITGLVGSGLVLQNNGGGDLALSPGAAAYSFSVPSGTAYSVSVLTQPANPTQVCTVAMATGTVPNGDVSDVAVTCTCSPYCPQVLLLAGTRSVTAGHIAGRYAPGGAWTTTRLTGSTQSGTGLAMLDDGTGVGLVRNYSDDKLKYTLRSSTAWSALADVGTAVTTRGKPSIGGGPAAEAVFQGADFKHYNSTFNGSWSAIGTVGTPRVPQVFGPSAPVVLTRGAGTFTVGYIQDATNRATSIEFAGTLWQNPANVSTELTDYWNSPSLVAPTTGPAMLMVWLASSGNQYRFSSYTGAVWSPAADITNATSVDPAALLALSGGEVLMAFRGLDGRLYALSYSAGSWGLPTLVAGGVYVLGSPALAKGQGGALAELAYVGLDGAAYHSRLAANRTWTTPVQVGTSVDFVSIASGP